MAEIVKRSSKTLKVIIISTGIVSMFLVLFALIMFNWLLGFTNYIGPLFKTAVAVFIPTAWAIHSLVIWNNWGSKKYEYDDNSLIVYGKIGLFGTRKTVYRYESIVSAEVLQTALAKRFDFGDIVLTIPELQKKVILKTVDNPQHYITLIKKNIANKGMRYQAQGG